MVFKPHFGVRAGWIDQHFSVHHGGLFDGQPMAQSIMEKTISGALALARGLESEWIVGKGWQLFGNVAGSMLFGKFEIDQNVALGASGSNQGYDIDYDCYQNVPNVEIQLGIAWNKYFNKNKYRIGVAAAYEFHEWFDQFNMKRFFGYTTHSELINGNLIHLLEAI